MWTARYAMQCSQYVYVLKSMFGPMYLCLLRSILAGKLQMKATIKLPCFNLTSDVFSTFVNFSPSISQLPQPRVGRRSLQESSGPVHVPMHM